MNKILSFPNQQQSMTKKFPKGEPGAHEEMDATKDIISVIELPFEGNCQKDYHLRVIFPPSLNSVGLFMNNKWEKASIL